MIEKLILATRITANGLPVIGMILLVPLVENDYVLTAIYVGIILIALAIHQDEKDRVFAVFGFIASFLAEALFLTTGVETFERTTLFGIMPLWLPFLWAYIFIAVRSAVTALEKYIR